MPLGRRALKNPPCLVAVFPWHAACWCFPNAVGTTLVCAISKHAKPCVSRPLWVPQAPQKYANPCVSRPLWVPHGPPKYANPAVARGRSEPIISESGCIFRSLASLNPMGTCGQGRLVEAPLWALLDLVWATAHSIPSPLRQSHPSFSPTLFLPPTQT